MADYRKPLTVVALLVVLGGVGAAMASYSSFESFERGGFGVADNDDLGAGSGRRRSEEVRGAGRRRCGRRPDRKDHHGRPGHHPYGIDAAVASKGASAGGLRRRHQRHRARGRLRGGYFDGIPGSAAADRQARRQGPVRAMNHLMVEVAGLGKVESQQVQGQDVLDPRQPLAGFTDLQAERRHCEPWWNSRSVPNILRVQNDFFTVESEIEQLSAQQASLDDQTTYATLTVNLEVAAVPPPAKPKGENTVVRAVKLAGHNVAVAGRAIILGVGWAFPLLILAGLALVVWRLRRHRAMTTPSPAGS